MTKRRRLDPLAPMTRADLPVHDTERSANVSRVARRLLAALAWEGSTPNELRRVLAGRDKPLFRDALERLQAGERVEIVETYRGETLVVPVFTFEGFEAPEILRTVLDSIRRQADELARLDDTVRALLRTIEGRP